MTRALAASRRSRPSRPSTAAYRPRGPPRPGARTGGSHRFFRLPLGLRLRGKLAPGLDLKAAGGYVVAPPSLHPDTGKPYRWLTAPWDAPLASAPEWLLALARRPVDPPPVPAPSPTGDGSAAYRRASAYLRATPPAISGSGGHTHTFLVAQKLAGFCLVGLSESDALALLREWNATCQPPWSERELARKWQQARERGTLVAPPVDRPRPGAARRPTPDVPPPEDSAPDIEPPPGLRDDDPGPVELADAPPLPPPSLASLASEADQTADDPDAALDPEEVPDPRSGRVRVASDLWREKLVHGEKKAAGGAVTQFVKPISANVTTILRHHPSWQDVVAYDEFRDCVVSTRPPPWDPEDAPHDVLEGEWVDKDSDRLTNWLARRELLDVPTAELERGLGVAADMARAHPVRDYLREARARWDGEPRVDLWTANYLGSAAQAYERGVGSRWLISAVARVMEPGCQVDCTLLLEGPQGTGKTSALRALVPVAEWYADTGIDLSNKDSMQALRAVWLYGLDELDSLKRGDVTRWKNFLSQTYDHYRSPYGRRFRNFLRQNVFCGTTNEQQYLVDASGNRRFWPFRCGRIDLSGLRRDRDQLWGEAFDRYAKGEPWHVDTADLRRLCEEQQAARMTEDPWLELVSQWLERPYIGGERDGYPERADLSQGVSTTDVLIHAVQVRRADLTRSDEMRIGTVLRELGWQRVRRRVGGARGWVYVRGEGT